jgi:hypothetical protein
MPLNRAISILVHGPSKSGKSTFASTAPAPRLIADCEGGTRFLDIKAVPWDPHKNAPPELDGTWDTAVVTLRTWDDVLMTYKWLQSGKHPFESLVVDSISELEASKQQDWGEILRLFMGLMRDFRDLCEHPTKPLSAVILIAMTKAGDDKLYHAHLQGQAATTVPYLVDVQAATHVQNWSDDQGNIQRVHRLLVGANPIYETGERVGGRLPAFLDNPKVEDILTYVFGPKASDEAESAPREEAV